MTGTNRFPARASIVFLLPVFFLHAQATPERQNPGVVHYLSGEFAKARDYFERKILAGGADASDSYWLAYTYLALGEKDRAVQPLEEYLQHEPSDEDALYALARTYAQLAEMSLQRIFQLDPESASAYRMRAIRLELEASWGEAIEQYEIAAKLAPSLEGIHASIGRIHARERKDDQRALAAYLSEIKLRPHSRAANEFLAEFYEANNWSDLARRHRLILESCFTISGEGCPAVAATGGREKAIFLLEKQEPEKSLPHLLQWRTAEPDNPDAYYYLGEAFTDLKVRTIQRLREANPSSYRLRQILAENYASIHKKAEAIEEYKKVLELAPEVAGVRYQLAKLTSDTRIQEAIPLLERELEMDPAHYMARSLLGRIYVALREPDKAIPLLEQTLRSRPELVEARKSLGQAWAAKKDFQRALPFYQFVAEKVPADEQIHFLLSQAYQALGDAEAAAREMKLHQEVLRQLVETPQGSRTRNN